MFGRAFEANAACTRAAQLRTRLQCGFLGAKVNAEQPHRRVGGTRHLAAQALFGMGTKTANEGIYGITVKDIDNKDLDLSKFKGKVLLVVNVASQCGFTPQYKELAALYDKYSSKGLVVLGAPSNEFGGQEPGSNAEIKQFAQGRGARFPLTSKLNVNGPDASPLYKFLKKEAPGFLTSDIKWNFTKILVDREGNVVGRYFSTTSPIPDIENDILKYL